MTTPRYCLNIRRSVHNILTQYGHAVRVSADGVLHAMLAWGHAGMPGAVDMRPLEKGEARTSIRANTDEITRMTMAYCKAYGVLQSSTHLIEQIVLRAPMPPQPEILSPYIDQLAQKSRGRVGVVEHVVCLSKRQTAHLKHLAHAWSLTVPQAAQVLLSSHPCMHLSPDLTPPKVLDTLRGVQALPIGDTQETVVIAG